MYVVIVFWLLHTPELIYSMDPEEMFPFNFEYTDAVQWFLEQKTKAFMLNLESQLIIKILTPICDLVHLNLNFSGKCIAVKTPSGSYEVTEESSQLCKTECTKVNLKYVTLLNEYISQAKKNFLYSLAPECHLILYPTNSDTIGKCVQKSLKTFECQCKPSYIIMVSRLLDIYMERSVAMADDFPVPTKPEEFTVFVLFLKFHPLSAGLYFSYLANKYSLVLKPILLENLNSTIENSDTETEFEGGLIEDRGSFLEYDKIVFQAFLKEIKRGRCNLIKFGGEYFDNFNPFTLFIILLILYKKWQTSKGDIDDLLPS